MESPDHSSGCTRTPASAHLASTRARTFRILVNVTGNFLRVWRQASLTVWPCAGQQGNSYEDDPSRPEHLPLRSANQGYHAQLTLSGVSYNAGVVKYFFFYRFFLVFFPPTVSTPGWRP